MKTLKSAIARLRQVVPALLRIDKTLDAIRINQGIILSELQGRKESRNLQDYEYKIFSQGGEDGIIQHLINAVGIKNKTFIEFGVEDFLESNCRYLLMKDNWSGFVIDGAANNIRRLKQSYYYWKHDLVAVAALITKDNINDLLLKSGFDRDLGVLSIDLDGNDYHILEAIKFFSPRILICEFNAVFGGTRKISVPYAEDFVRTDKHYSNLYFGASLPAITHLAKDKGYSLVGINSLSSNAFFIRNDLFKNQIDIRSVDEAFSPSRFRESIDREGSLTYLAGDSRLELIKGLPVMNVETNAIESL